MIKANISKVVWCSFQASASVLLLKAEKSGIHLVLFKNQVQRAFSPQLQSNLLESCSNVKYWAQIQNYLA